MRPLSFSKPKTPGFGISRSFYMTALSSSPTMPPILSVLNPDGSGGAVVGFGAPLEAGADKELLRHPMERGSYVLATKDRKTVLRLLILSKEEAGFDPEVVARSPLVTLLDPEIVARIRATWTIAQATFSSHHPSVYPSIHFLLEIMQRIALLTDGVVADPISQRYLLPADAMHVGTTDTEVDVRDAVTVGFRDRPDGLYAYTLGLQKFSLPEFEVTGNLPGTENLLIEFLLGVSQSVLAGHVVASGQRVGSRSIPFEIREGGFDRGMWEGIPVLELLPPTRNTPNEALLAWQAEGG